MNTEAATTIAGVLLDGACDTLRTMLGDSLGHSTPEISEIAESDLLELCSHFPVALAGVLPNGASGIALLLSADAALALAASLRDNAPEDATALTEEDRGLLKELGDAVLSSSVARLMETWGQEAGQFQQVLLLEGEDAAADLPRILGDAPVAARFSFEDHGSVAGPAILLFSQNLEELGPGDAPATDVAVRGGAAETSPLLSEEEMNDILSGFGLDAAEAELAGPALAPAPAAQRPDNLEMVLDISLTAVARLGGIEMPIGEILSLGPGAIIEVGHLVDEPVELLINGRLIARGEVVVVDEKFGLRITEIVSPRTRIESLR